MKSHNTDGYQHNFSRLLGQAMHDKARRYNKARKIVAVISDYARGRERAHRPGCRVFDGHHDPFIADSFKTTVGVDIDVEALQYATRTNNPKGVWFLTSGAMDVPFRDDSFDAVVCAHVHEHVPDARRMAAGIHRVLKPGGHLLFFRGKPTQPHGAATSAADPVGLPETHGQSIPAMGRQGKCLLREAPDLLGSSQAVVRF